MRPLSEPASRVAAKNFQRKFVALGRIVSEWPNIVGAEFALRAQPVKINYRPLKHKPGQSGKETARPGQQVSSVAPATLEIAVNQSEATLFHYQKDVILQRINHIFGSDWIGDIRFVAAEMPDISRKQKKVSALLRRGLSPVAEQNLSGILQDVPDEPIKSALHRLGQGIFAG
jgi:hypothetical protein